MSFGFFRMAVIIGAVAMLSAGLALGATWVFGWPFGFMAIIGSMGLTRVAINDSILVLAAVQQDPEARAGDPDAIRDVVVRSTRHVTATSLTTVAIAGGVAGRLCWLSTALRRQTCCWPATPVILLRLLCSTPISNTDPEH